VLDLSPLLVAEKGAGGQTDKGRGGLFENGKGKGRERRRQEIFLRGKRSKILAPTIRCKNLP
jgi:hypothetical protein